MGYDCMRILYVHDLESLLVSITRWGYRAFSRSLLVSGFSEDVPLLIPADNVVSNGALGTDDTGDTEGEKSEGPRGIGIPPLRGVVGGLDALLAL